MTSVEKRLADAAKITDPMSRALRLHTTVAPAARTLLDRCYDERARAVLEANQAGAGYRTIAKALDISPPRAQQLVAEGRRLASQGRRRPVNQD